MKKNLLYYIALGLSLGYASTDVLAQGRSANPQQAPTELKNPSDKSSYEAKPSSNVAFKPEADRAEMHLMKITAADPQLSMLNNILDHADLKSSLEQNGPYTIFAPLDQAFERLEVKDVNELLKSENKDKLRAWVAGHIVEGAYLVSELYDGQKLQTITSQVLTVKREADKITIDGIEILETDVKASNGVVHVINAVMLTSDQKEQEAKRRRDDANMLKSGKRGMSKP
jgi:uncharacterized surface protein with fasciclin (FAS1) repeats